MLMVVAVTWVLPMHAHGATFSATCNRFEADGNEFGSAGGAFDYVDEFDDGTLAPDWLVLLGTAIEAGGGVTVRDPGFPVPLGSTPYEISTIENEQHGVVDGSGSWTALSHWAPTLPSLNTEFHMQLYSTSPIVEAAGISVNDSATGSPAGLSISQSVTQGFGPTFTTITSNAVAISSASVTGEIVLKLALDDTTDLLTCSFSLDGGLTFQSPFPPMHVFNAGVTDYDVLLGAAAFGSAAGPQTARSIPMKLFDTRNPGGPDARKIVVRVQAQNFVPPNFGDPVTLGATLNVSLDGVSQCFHMPGGSFWSMRSGGFSYRYLDRQGAYGPLKQLAIRRNGRRVLQMKALILGKLGGVLPVPQGTTSVEGDVRLSLGGGDDFCGSTVGGEIATDDGERFRVRNAPPPGACTISACSPSGAFLD
jgi:hypothetical protein